MSGVSIRDLSVEFLTPAGAAPAVRSVSLDIASGEILGLVGESGSGKSTIAFALMGLLAENARVVSGTAIIAGGTYELTRADATAGLRGRAMAMIFQDPLLSLNPVFKIKAHLFEVLRRVAPGEDAKTRLARAQAALAEVSIPNPRQTLEDYPHQLSGGMRQRVVIAMALLARPALLIADEPTTALDVTVEAQVMREILKLREAIDCSVLLITHSLGLVTQYCDRVCVLYAGERLETGAARAIRRRPGHPYTRLLFDCEIGIATARGADPGANRFRVIGGELPAPGRQPSGCIFHPRCDVALPECRAIVPPDYAVAGDASHLARCIRLAE